MGEREKEKGRQTPKKRIRNKKVRLEFTFHALSVHPAAAAAAVEAFVAAAAAAA